MTKLAHLGAIVLVLFVISIEVNCNDNDFPNMDKFLSWMKKYEKKYKTDEILKQKFRNFIVNHLHVRELNEQHSGETEFELNKFADLTTDEFKSQILMRSEMKDSKKPKQRFFDSQINIKDLPDSYDWRDHGAVTPIKDQGSVGSCWAFSAVQNLEGQFFLKGNPLTNLSVEQIVDCDGFQEKNGEKACCGVFGGWPFLVFEYVKSAGGIESEEDYSYCSGLNEACFPCGPPGYNSTKCGPNIPYCYLKDSCQAKLDPTKFVKNLQVSDWKQFSENETDIAQALVATGPLSVALDATLLQFYRKGVFNPILGCSKTHLNHAVLMVGYGTEKDKDYWTIKNSWGKKWGEEGYFRILRNKGLCGINTQVTTSILA